MLQMLRFYVVLLYVPAPLHSLQQQLRHISRLPRESGFQACLRGGRGREEGGACEELAEWKSTSSSTLRLLCALMDCHAAKS